MFASYSFQVKAKIQRIEKKKLFVKVHQEHSRKIDFIFKNIATNREKKLKSKRLG